MFFRSDPSRHRQRKHHDPADADARPWQLSLAILFMVQLFTSAGFSLVFPFLPLYVGSLHSTTGWSIEILSSLVIASQGFTMMFAAPVWGALADRHGRKLMVMRATLGGAVVLSLMGVVQTAEQLILLRAVQGIVTGVVSANNALLASLVPRERIGFAMGTLQVGLWSGLAVGPIVGSALADAFGFAVPFFFTGAMLLAAGVAVSLGIHEPKRSDNFDSRRLTFAQQWKHVLQSPGVSMVLLVRLLTTISRSALTPIAPLFIVTLLPASEADRSIYAGAFMAVSSLTSTFSAVYLGRLGDRIGHRTIVIGCALAAGLLYIPQVLVTDAYQLIALQGIAGITLGGLIAAPSALLATYTQAGEEGSVFGLSNSIASAGRAVSALIGGTIAALIGLRGTFGFVAVLYFVVTVVAWYALPVAKARKKHDTIDADVLETALESTTTRTGL